MEKEEEITKFLEASAQDGEQNKRLDLLKLNNSFIYLSVALKTHINSVQTSFLYLILFLYLFVS